MDMNPESQGNDQHGEGSNAEALRMVPHELPLRKRKMHKPSAEEPGGHKKPDLQIYDEDNDPRVRDLQDRDQPRTSNHSLDGSVKQVKVNIGKSSQDVQEKFSGRNKMQVPHMSNLGPITPDEIRQMSGAAFALHGQARHDANSQVVAHRRSENVPSNSNHAMLVNPITQIQSRNVKNIAPQGQNHIYRNTNYAMINNESDVLPTDHVLASHYLVFLRAAELCALQNVILPNNIGMAMQRGLQYMEKVKCWSRDPSRRWIAEAYPRSEENASKYISELEALRTTWASDGAPRAWDPLRSTIMKCMTALETRFKSARSDTASNATAQVMSHAKPPVYPKNSASHGMPQSARAALDRVLQNHPKIPDPNPAEEKIISERLGSGVEDIANYFRDRRTRENRLREEDRGRPAKRGRPSSQR